MVEDDTEMIIEEPEQVLFGIMENQISSLNLAGNPDGHPEGFPKVLNLGNTDSCGSRKTGKSLFKQRMEQKRANQNIQLKSKEIQKNTIGKI